MYGKQPLKTMTKQKHLKSGTCLSELGAEFSWCTSWVQGLVGVLVGCRV